MTRKRKKRGDMTWGMRNHVHNIYRLLLERELVLVDDALGAGDDLFETAGDPFLDVAGEALRDAAGDPLFDETPLVFFNGVSSFFYNIK